MTPSSPVSTPTSLPGANLAGHPGTYADFLKQKNLKPATVDESKNAGFAIRVKASNDILNELEKNNPAAGLSGAAQSLLPQNVLTNWLKSPEYKQMEQAQRDFINAVLRRESGAAISPTEFDSARQQYFPQPGDDQGTLGQKRNNRELALQGLVLSAGGALSDDFLKPAGAGEIIERDGIRYQDDGTGNFVPLALEGSVSGNAQIGSLSQKYESGGDPAAIGYDSTGGYSYGTYQLAHNNAKKFIEQSPYASQFSGLTFNSPQFRYRWKQVAAKDPGGFKNAQHDFIERTHYEPQVQRLVSAGIDASRFSPALTDVVWSTAVQHGGNTDVIEKAIRRAGPNASERQIIDAIYAERATRFGTSTPEVRKAVQSRLAREKADALSRIS